MFNIFYGGLSSSLYYNHGKNCRTEEVINILLLHKLLNTSYRKREKLVKKFKTKNADDLPTY
jgi:hypothetical protein